jgi:hypothetical protein
VSRVYSLNGFTVLKGLERIYQECSVSNLFYDVSSIDYPIIDADAHVNEPPDCLP